MSHIVRVNLKINDVEAYLDAVIALGGEIRPLCDSCALYFEGRRQGILNLHGESSVYTEGRVSWFINETIAEYVRAKAEKHLAHKGFGLLARKVADRRGAVVLTFARADGAQVKIECLNGRVSVSVSGISGEICLELTEELEKDLGIVAKRELTEEYYRPDPCLVLVGDRVWCG